MWMIEAIDGARTKSPFDLWAYVIMPEHVHLVVLPHQDTRISEILTSLKQTVSKRAINWLKNNSQEFLQNIEDLQPNGKRSYRFWQRGGGYDRNLRGIRDIHEKIQYVHFNPVSRGLVENPIEWRWSRASAWETGIDEPLAIDRQEVPRLANLDEKNIRSGLLE